MRFELTSKQPASLDFTNSQPDELVGVIRLVTGLICPYRAVGQWVAEA